MDTYTKIVLIELSKIYMNKHLKKQINLKFFFKVFLKWFFLAVVHFQSTAVMHISGLNYNKIDFDVNGS